VVIGSTDPGGSRPYIGALLLAYYDPDGRLVYAGRAGSGINTAALQRLPRRLQPLAMDNTPLDLRRRAAPASDRPLS
jgi:bifunctional non-homologous end joining protein LigD